VTYGSPGEVNHDLDPGAARQIATTWSVQHAAPPRSLTRDEVDRVWDRLHESDRATPLARMTRVLLTHQCARGAGLGDAAAVLRLAGSADPLGDLVDVLRP
jgi:hypothetical protein